MSNQPLKNTPIDGEALVKINEAVGVLNDYGYNTARVMEWLAGRLEEQRVQPTEVDRLWPLAGKVSITEHLVPNVKEIVKSASGVDVVLSHGSAAERPTLSCRLQVGMAYSLTPGQRDVIRDRFHMTPAPLVEVIECAMYADNVHIRRVTLKSCEHVDPRRRAVMTKFSIDEWGQFCADAKRRDIDREEAKEKLQSESEASGDGTGKTVKPGKAAKAPSAKAVNLAQLMNEYGVD
jgi:hypothetical protein